MARIRNRDTKPEKIVRSLVHGMGFRYRLHVAELPGRPDMVFQIRHKAIFVHGCFWHRHLGCKLARLPKSRLDFWRPKLEANRERDVRNQRALEELGWSILVIWECELADLGSVAERVKRFMDG